MSVVLTASQERSLDLSAHLCVTANAGAGKTSVLARRFVEIILRTDTKLAGIVAITFTEQAAGELRKKVHDVLLERERAAGTGPAERRRIAEARNQLSSAIIGTIHSFCGRILRMYPAEADVDASFTVVEGQDRARLISESIAETFEELMGRGGEAGGGPPDPFRALLRAVPPLKLEKLLLRLFAQREQMYRYFPRGGNRKPDADSAPLLDRIAGIVLDRAVESGWTEHARAVAAAAGGKGAAALTGLLGDPASPPTSDRHRHKIEEILLASGGLIFTAKQGFRATFLGKRTEEDLPPSSAAFLRTFEQRYIGVLRSARAEGAAGREAAYRGLLETLERTFLSAEGKYTARKEELGVLDFEDLQIKAVELVAREDVRERLRSEYRYLLVDEFQDTNDLQYEILRGLAGDGTGGNLFIVGDPKQSIYGFRNADVGIFHDVRTRIVAESLARGGPADGGAVVLAESFRPLPEIAAFVNLVFSGLLRRGASRHEVDYDEIIVGRSDPPAGTPGTPGTIALLLAGADASGEHGGAVREECVMVARWLKEAAAAGRGFGECALLLRDRTNLPLLEKAFEEEGVPYLLAGGVGFFQTQEVYDFLNYLRFLVSPGDDTALAGVLRSPFFGLTDTDLYSISSISSIASNSVGPGASFWEKLGAAAGAEPIHAGVRRAHETLLAHRSIADRVSVPRLLRRIAADTGWIGVMAGLSHGPQRRENFLKLLDLARRRGSAGPFTLYDFMSYLDHRAEEEEREGQASTAATGSAVRVMTVHAAKGLEFPVVVLPFLDRAQRPESEPIVDARFGIGFRVSGEEEQPPLYACLRALSEEKRLAEEKRIFYVACTRARDALVLSGNERMKAGSPAPLGWLMEAAAARGVRETGSRLDFGGVRVKVRDASVPAAGDQGSPAHQAHQAYTEVEVQLSLPVRRAIPAAAGPGPGIGPVIAVPPAVPPVVRPRVLTGTIPDTGGGESYSATMLKTYLECPARYYLTHLLGLVGLVGLVGPGAPESGERDRDDDAVDADVDPNVDDKTGGGLSPGVSVNLAALEGELTHQALSALTAGDDERAIGSRVESAIAALPTIGEIAGLRERVSGNVLLFSKSAAGKEILSRPGARTEFQVSASLGDAVVMGKIDRLYEGSDGSVEFVDYKTDSISAGGAAGRAQAHRHQMELYAFLISRLYRQKEVRGTLIFLKAGPASFSFEFRESDFARLEKSVRRTIAAIRAGTFPPAPGGCDGCPGAGGPCPVVPPTP